MKIMDQSSAQIIGKNFSTFQLPYYELQFRSTVKLIFVDIIFAKCFEFQSFNPEQIR